MTTDATVTMTTRTTAVENVDEFPLDEGFAEAFERSLLLHESKLMDHEAEEENDEEPVVHGLLASVMREFPALGSTDEAEGHKLRDTVKTAAGYGSYVTVRIGNLVMIWHVDSGATLTQISPDQVKLFDPPLERVDKGSVNFKSAEHASATDVIMYKTTSLTLIQMESGLSTAPVTTYIICNPRLRPRTRLLGLNTMKDLRLSERFGDDTLVDQLGRPFRKIPQTRLKMLRQQVSVWNRKQARLHHPEDSKSTASPKQLNTRGIEAQTSITTPVPKHAESSQAGEHEGTDGPSNPAHDTHIFAHAEFNAKSFDKAEDSNNVKYFRKCILSAPHASNTLMGKQIGQRLFQISPLPETVARG